MKRLLFPIVFCMAGLAMPVAQTVQKQAVKVNTEQSDAKTAEIKFDNLSHDFGTFSEKNAVVKCTFKFTNVGSAPLIIHQAIASCGCTVPTYTKDPIKPGQAGSIEVTYNGKGKFPGRFRKTITVRSNAKENGVVRLAIEGEMTE